MANLLWSFELSLVAEDGVKNVRTFDLASEAQSDALGVPLSVSALGVVYLNQQALVAGHPPPSGNGAWVLEVPPFVKTGRPPDAAARWAMHLELKKGDRTQAFRFTRATGEVFSLGRHDQNVLRMPTDSLARKHAGFFVDARGQLWVSDFQSPNGTWLNNQKLERWTLWKPYDELRAGQVTIHQAEAARHTP
jgi:hypothetical protein